MVRLNVGVIVLLAISILIYFGVAQRVLDRMRLTDKGAFLIIAALIAGSFIDLPLYRGNIDITLNIGGGLVPLALAGYLLSKAGTNKERIRAVIGALLTGVIIYLIGSVFMRGGHEEFYTILDPIYIYPLVAGLIAYIAGRSRRSAFIAATVGVLLLDIFHTVYLVTAGIPGTVHIGGAGAFDSIVLAGIIAVMLAELIGEGRERLQGGPDSRGRAPELINNLKDIDEQKQNAHRGDKNEK
ncbi:MAG: hypothetical protein JM58_14025 [Peptococcaceae bacterium BICA1-8]|nr:MAG: hypothetical protein JM58_14025 [Peptococcaceae bacterium BICA1-8]